MGTRLFTESTAEGQAINIIFKIVPHLD